MSFFSVFFCGLNHCHLTHEVVAIVHKIHHCFKTWLEIKTGTKHYVNYVQHSSYFSNKVSQMPVPAVLDFSVCGSVTETLVVFQHNYSNVT